MIIVKTNINHNINEQEFKEVISITGSLIKYQGNEYLDKLKALNTQYEIENHRILTEHEYAIKNINYENNNKR